MQQVDDILHSAESLAYALNALPVFAHSENAQTAPLMNAKLSETIADVMREKGRYEVQVGREKEPVLGKI